MKSFFTCLLLSLFVIPVFGQDGLSAGTVLVKDIRSYHNENPLNYIIYTDTDSMMFKVTDVTQENVNARMTAVYSEIDTYLGDLAEDKQIGKIIVDYYPPPCIGGVFESLELNKTQIGVFSDALIFLDKFRGAKVLQVIWDDCHYLPSPEELHFYELYKMDENFEGTNKERKKAEKEVSRKNQQIIGALANIEAINGKIKSDIEQKCKNRPSLQIIVGRRE